jgi:hypothetical protein
MFLSTTDSVFTWAMRGGPDLWRKVGRSVSCERCGKAHKVGFVLDLGWPESQPALPKARCTSNGPHGEQAGTQSPQTTQAPSSPRSTAPKKNEHHTVLGSLESLHHQSPQKLPARLRYLEGRDRTLTIYSPILALPCSEGTVPLWQLSLGSGGSKLPESGIKLPTLLGTCLPEAVRCFDHATG